MEAEEKVVAPKPTAKESAKDNAADDKAKDRKPIELGSAEDYQLQQAMNHLQGRTVAVAKAKPETKAEANISGNAPNATPEPAKK